MGITILINIHVVELALEYADRIVGIRDGRIVFDGPSEAVDQAVLNSIYGGDVPEDQKLSSMCAATESGGGDD
jgi:phosphonate transport system ATP-binding protein